MIVRWSEAQQGWTWTCNVCNRIEMDKRWDEDDAWRAAGFHHVQAHPYEPRAECTQALTDVLSEAAEYTRTHAPEGTDPVRVTSLGAALMAEYMISKGWPASREALGD